MPLSNLTPRAILTIVSNFDSDTHSLSTIHRDDLERLNSICFEFFRTSLLSALAVPDVLEAESPIAIIYDQIEKLSVDTWAHFDPFFRPVRRILSSLPLSSS